VAGERLQLATAEFLKLRLRRDSTLVLHFDGLTEADHDVVAATLAHAAVMRRLLAASASEIQAHVLDRASAMIRPAGCPL
jgi:hypothetical protein